MTELKVYCDCGQKYKFDVEPVNNQMPFTVACPICKRDGTAKANAMLQQMAVFRPAGPVPVAAAIAPSPAPAQFPVSSTGAPAPIAPAAPAPSAPRPASRLPSAPVAPRQNPFSKLAEGVEGASDAQKWKWWYFILAGVCIGGYSIWQAYDQHRIKPLGSLFLAVFCIAIGIWDFQHKRRKKRASQQNETP